MKYFIILNTFTFLNIWKHSTRVMAQLFITHQLIRRLFCLHFKIQPRKLCPNNRLHTTQWFISLHLITPWTWLIVSVWITQRKWKSSPCQCCESTALQNWPYLIEEGYYRNVPRHEEIALCRHTHSRMLNFAENQKSII